MGIALKRERNQAVFIGSEIIKGGQAEFWLKDDHRLSFRTASPILAFGLRVDACGALKLGWDFEVKDAELELVPPADSGGRCHAFNAGDRDRALTEAASHLIRAAAGRLIARRLDHVASAWLDLADDYVLSRMSYRQRCVDKLEELGEDVPWKDQRFYEDRIEESEREAASLDEQAYANSELHDSRPGYVVVCDGKLADKGDRRFKDDRGTGWVQRHVCIHLGEAHRFARELGRDSEDIRVERIRIIEGRPYVVVPEGLVEPEWSLDEPVLTGTLMTNQC